MKCKSKIDFEKNKIKMKIKPFFLFFILITSINFIGVIRESKSDVVWMQETGTGNFIPVNSTNLRMTNANVIFNIDATNHHEKISIDFRGNYTIFNPDEAKEITLVAPFSTVFKNLENSSLIKVNKETIPHKCINYNITNDYWKDYFEYMYMNSRKFLITNVTIPSNDSITLEYSFTAFIDTAFYSNDGLRINYDVGTSRAWNGTITERVEFRVYGEPTKSYSSFSGYGEEAVEYNCTLSDLEDGRSYSWNWKEEVIKANTVYIYYSYTNPWGHILFYIGLPAFYCGLIILVIIVIVKISNKPRKIEPKTSVKYCTNCGNLLDRNMIFCTKCGFELAKNQN
jgi:hypothetical protein